MPSDAATFPRQMDPQEQLDWLLPFGDLLETGERIASFTLTADADAAALGFTISSGSGRTAAATADGRSIRAWFEVDEAEQDNAAWDDLGTDCVVEAEIVTDASPARTRQRSFVLRVRHL